MAQILETIANKEDQPLLKKHVLKADKIENGLSTFCGDEHIDMLAVVHHHFNWVKRFFHGSHTLEMAKRMISRY